MSIVNEFLLSMEGYYREFDSSAFVQNSKGALSGKFEALNAPLDASVYIKSLNNAINSMEDLWIDSRALKDLTDTIKSSPRFDSLGTVPALMDTTIRINTDYLKDYSQNVTINMNSLFETIMKPEGATPAYIANAVSKINNESFINTAKKNIVKSNENLADMSARNSMMPSTSAAITCNKDFITTQVVPFANNFNTLKASTLAEAKALKDIIVDTVEAANTRNRAAGNFSNSNPDYTKDINRALYQGQRGLIEVISFTTYAMLRKMHAIESNCRTCNIVCKRLTEAATPVKTLVTEGVLTDSITSDNINDLADDMVHGNPAAYIDVANRVYDFHRGVISSMVADPVDDPNGIVDQFVEGFDYDTYPYDCVLELTTELGMSLDTLIASLDDALLIFDEAIRKAGLVDAIDVRYKDSVSMISDTHKYDSATEIGIHGNGNMDVYKEIMHELKDYPDNMTKVTAAIRDLFKKIQIFEDRLETNVNGEFKNAALIKEMQVFVESLHEQYKNLVNNIAGQMMIRLKKIALDAEKISVSLEERRDEPFEVNEFVEDSDFMLEMDKLQYDYESGVTDIVMETMMDEFQKKMTMKTRHLRLVEEVAIQNGQTQQGQAASTTTTTTTGNTQTQNTTQGNAGTNAAQALDKASASVDKMKGRLENLKNKINDSFESLINKYVSKMQVNNIKKFLDVNRNALTTADFSNNQITMQPYDQKQPIDQIVPEIQTVTQQCGSIKPADVTNLKTPKAVFERIFGNMGVTIKDDSDISSCGSQTSKQIQMKYTTGKTNGRVNRTVVKDVSGTVKNIVGELDSYVNGLQDQMINNVRGLQRQVHTMSDNFVEAKATTEAVELAQKYMGFLYEADGGATTTAEDNQAKAAGGSKVQNVDGGAPDTAFGTYELMNSIQVAARVYTGALFNAVRDRIKDYLSILGQLTKTQTTDMTGAADNGEKANAGEVGGTEQAAPEGQATA